MVNFATMKQEQLKLSGKIELIDRFSKVETIAGFDQTYNGNNVISCVVILDKNMKVIEKKCATTKVSVKYKAGYLAYREMPAMVKAYSMIENEPDIVLVDGQGITHPRRFGIASHFGLAINKPVIGVSKNLYGKVKEGKIFIEDELRGFELVTREHAKPIYVSPGHMVTPGSAIRIVQKCIRAPHKMPEPLHIAHRLARKELKKVIQPET